MLKEIFKNRGLDDQVIDGILNDMKERKVYITKHENMDERYPKIKNQKTELEKLVSQREQKIDELSKSSGNNEELQKQILELKKLNETTKSDYETRISNMEFDYSLNNALKGAKCKNVKALKALLDMEAINFKNGKLEGLDEQLETLKANEGYLFEEATNTGSVGTFGKVPDAGFNFKFNSLK